MNDVPTRNLRLLLEYDGTAYAGWQQQDNLPSIQAAVTDAVEKLTHHRPTLRVAGRTDAGVHAMGQVASFFTPSTLEARRLAPGINNYLPRDITVHRCDDVPATFEPRRDSCWKQYRYRVYQGPQPAALEGHRAWQRRAPLDPEAMAEAANALLGEHDFDAFRSAHCDAPHARRRMHRIDITPCPRPPLGQWVDITLYANAFCRHMCRILAGTLVEVGQGKREAEDVARVLSSRDRTQAGPTAPPHGLTLVRVSYTPWDPARPPRPVGVPTRLTE